MRNELINQYKINAFESKEDFLNQISNEKKILIAMNAEKILQNNEELKDIINKNIGYPDGMGAVMALNQKGLKAIKIPGAEFWLDIINKFQNKKSFYILGSTDEIINKCVKKLKIDFPDINILGYRNGYINDDEKNILINELKNKKPDIVFVAQGSPRQEFLMNELMKSHKALYMGLGGSFDLYVGVVKPVPNWWKKIFKWEGLYRALNDFSNIDRWKRQSTVPKLMLKLIFRKL